MAATSGRVICSKCGANNFDTQAACWKCGVPLTGIAPSPRPVMPVAATSTTPTPRSDFPASQSIPPPDPTVAMVASICLAIFFPFVAVPVGIIFLMLDDRRKIEIGRLTLIAGIISTIVQLFLTGLFLQATLQQGMALFKSGIGAHAASGDTGDDTGIGLPHSSTAPRFRIDPSSVSTPPPTDNVPFPDPPNLTHSSP